MIFFLNFFLLLQVSSFLLSEISGAKVMFGAFLFLDRHRNVWGVAGDFCVNGESPLDRLRRNEMVKRPRGDQGKTKKLIAKLEKASTAKQKENKTGKKLER